MIYSSGEITGEKIINEIQREVLALFQQNFSNTLLCGDKIFSDLLSFVTHKDNSTPQIQRAVNAFSILPEL